MQVKRRLPLLIAFSLVLLVLFPAFYVFNVRLQLMDFYAVDTLRREQRIEFYLKLGEKLNRTDALDELKESLEDARAARDIDFYVLQYQGEAVFWGHPEDKREEVDIDYKTVGEPVITESVSYKVVQLDPETRLTVGIFKFPDVYIKANMQKLWKQLAQYIVVLFIIAIFTAGFFLRDITALLRSMQGSKRRDYRKISTRSLESEIIRQGLSGYQNTVDDLHSKSETLERQILPSLRSEILSGKKPPYDFGCTMVRTDINNFSSIYNKYPIDKFISTINTFFTDVSHIVSRYGGLVHEFVGDEVIFYFKDENHVNSFAIAASAVRDINAAAEIVSARTLREDGYAFTVKSSAAHGTVRFGHLVNGFSLAGSVLIETVRILSQVTEKDGNVLCFDGQRKSLLAGLCEMHNGPRVHLKGFVEECQLVHYDGHKPLAEFLTAIKAGSRDVSALTYYRSDRHLEQILRFLQSEWESLQDAVVFDMIKVLRSFALTKSDNRPRTAWLGWLKLLVEKRETAAGKRADWILSSAVMLGLNLVPSESFDEALESELKRLLEISDKRLVANTLEVLWHFKSEADHSFVVDLMYHADNRVAANALVYEGMHELTPEVVKQLKKMLKSYSGQRVASAIYAVGEIAGHHRKRDQVYYSTHPEFLRLVNRIPKFARSQNEMIRKQALLAATRCGDPEIIALIMRWVSAQKDPELKQEILDVLNKPVQSDEKPAKNIRAA